MKVENVIELLGRVHSCCEAEESGSSEHITEWVDSDECKEAIECLKAITA